jgi:hypothetical protein
VTPNGKPGDHPLTDMLAHGKHPFPPDMEEMLRAILALDPIFPDGKRWYVDQLEWERRFFDWERGKNLDQGREALIGALSELRVKKTTEPLGVPADWPFDQAPNVAAITTVGVIHRALPVLVVQHFGDDHSWGFLCGTTDETKDGRVIGMGEALLLDPGLRSIADLPPGWIARRSSVGGAWSKELDAQDT